MLAGVVLLMDNLGLLAFLRISAWGLIWPLFLIALGLRILWRISSRPAPVEAEQTAIPLAGARSARIHIQHGAGRLQVHAGAEPGKLVAGRFGGGLDYRTRQDGDRLDVDLQMRSRDWLANAPWEMCGSGALDWDLGLSGDIPLALDLETGANDTRLELGELQVTDLRLKTGASSTEVALPARAGFTRVKVESGAAAVTIRVPEGVAARVRVEGALSGTDVDTRRFPQMGDVYQSPDYEAAANKAEIEATAAVGSVTVR